MTEDLVISFMVSLRRMDNGAYRAAASMNGKTLLIAVGMTRMQSLDKIFAEIRKYIQSQK